MLLYFMPGSKELAPTVSKCLDFPSAHRGEVSVCHGAGMHWGPFPIPPTSKMPFPRLTWFTNTVLFCLKTSKFSWRPRLWERPILDMQLLLCEEGEEKEEVAGRGKPHVCAHSKAPTATNSRSDVLWYLFTKLVCFFPWFYWPKS